MAAQFQYASLTPTTSLPTIVPGTGSGGNLLMHTIATASGTRSTDTTAYVCWYGTTSCASQSNNQMGWELDLTVKKGVGLAPDVAEQVLFNPLVVSHFFNTNTDIPTLAEALTCDTNSEQSFSVGISMATGDASAGFPTTNTATAYSYFTNTAVGTIAVATQASGTSTAVQASDGSQCLRVPEERWHRRYARHQPAQDRGQRRHAGSPDLDEDALNDEKAKQMTLSFHPRRCARGFTLIEVMIAVAIVGILVAVAFPAYNQSVRKSRRSDAKAALLDLAQREERYFSTTNQYTDVGARHWAMRPARRSRWRAR